MTSPDPDHFLCSLDEVFNRIEAIDPKAYDRSRNYLDGAVTWLSPFLTHGVISTRTVANRVLERHRTKACYRLLFELAWREYFHREWQIHGEAIFEDLRQPQHGVQSPDTPEAIVQASTGITVVDATLARLVTAGTLHNHARMWIAGITCNLAHTHWSQPARWMYHHLLDGDLASNTLSWQWIAGTASHKQYVANQANVNKYSRSSQSGSWLDVDYEAFEHFSTPSVMHSRSAPDLPSSPPGSAMPDVNGRLYLRSIWDLDPLSPLATDSGGAAVRSVVFIDTALDARFPLSEKRWQLVQHWARACNAELFCGTVDQLTRACCNANVERREYTATRDWPGTPIDRDWLYPLPERSFSSFSQFWKQVRGSVGL